MSLWKCPLCGKQNSIMHYDPTDFVNDILIILKRGLGHGKGWEDVEEYSLLDGSDPELLDLISDRVAVLYDMLYEDVEDDEDDEKLIDDINAVLNVYDVFDNLHDAADALLGQFLEYEEEVPEQMGEGALVVVEEEVADNYRSLSELDKELLIGEAEEDEYEDEDINDLDEEKLE